MRGGAAAVVLALLVGGLYVITRSSGPEYPSEWDARVAPLAAWVEEARGHTFEHPVEVNFLTAEEYSAESRSEPGQELSEEEQAEMDDAVATMRALALVEGDVDLQSAFDDLSDSGTLAFYSLESKQVFVRGTELTPAVRVTLVHELVHALQDQALDLSEMTEEDGDPHGTLRPLVEGDASRIEQIYILEELTDAEREEYETSTNEAAAGVEGELDAVPGALQAIFSSPYLFGPATIDIADAEGGNAAVDDLLQNPPTAASMFDPVDTPAADNRATDHPALEVDLPSGAEELDSGTFGSVEWYLTLSSRIDPARALAATIGIQSDGMRSYRQDGTVCVSGVAVMRDDKEAAELRDALTAWVEAGPADAAETSASGTRITFRSCDPGTDAGVVGKVGPNTLQLPAIRAQVFAELMASGGGDPENSRCGANAYVEEFGAERLTAADFEPTDAEMRSFFEVLRTTC